MNTPEISCRYLAQELVEEILPKLTAKSLLRFRLVSKSWDSLIHSERFIKTHLDNSIANPAFANHLIFFNYLDKKPGLSFSVSTKEEEATKMKRYPTHLLMKELIDELPPNGMYNFRFPSLITVVGSCNGLVCFWKRAKGSYCFYLCNPSTRTSIQLPGIGIVPREGVTRCGFGFDEGSGAYKVFVVMCIDRDTLEYRYEVYSSKTNAWRTVELPRVDWGRSPRASSEWKNEFEGILVSGKLHWQRATVKYGGEVFVDLIIFDLENGVIETMDLPCDAAADNVYSFNTSLAVLDRCLTVLHYHDGHLDVWVMMEYGVKESWILVMDFDFPYSFLSMSKAATLGLGPNGEILMTYGSFFMVYDVKKCQLLQMKKFEALYDGEGAHLFVESLVCPQRFLEHS